MGHFKFNPILPALIVLATALGWQWAVSASGAGASPAATTPAGLPLAPHLRLTAKDGAANDQYGASVAASEDTIVIGAHSDDIDGRSDQGSVYVFSGAGGDWTIQQKLTAPDGEAGDQFGTAVAISGNLLVVGAPRDKTRTNTAQGSAYVFLRSSGGWAFQQKLTAQDGAAGDQFGASVAISGGNASARLKPVARTVIFVPEVKAGTCTVENTWMRVVDASMAAAQVMVSSDLPW